MSDLSPIGGGDELLALARRVLGEAGGGEQVEVFAARSRSVRVDAHGGAVESLSVAESAGVGVRCIVDGRQGFAHCGPLDEASVRATLAEARDNARFAEVDPWAGLAEPDGVSPVMPPFNPEAIGALGVDDKVAMAVALERAASSADPRVTGVRVAAYADHVGEVAIVSTTGIEALSRDASAGLSVSALANDDTMTTVGGWGDAARDPRDLDVDAVAGVAVDRAVRMLGAGPIPSTRLAVVFEPRQATTLLNLLVGTLSGVAVVKGRSLFADRVGETIASPLLTLVDDPTDPRSLAADSHDGEGLACRPTALVEGGVLQGFLHNTWTARRLGTASTASASRGYRSTPGVSSGAVVTAAGSGTRDELIAGVTHGLLVQSISGVHSGVNMVSGDVSVGVEGLLITDGEIGPPVREVTLASTLQRMLLGISAVGADVEWLPGGMAVPTIVVGEMALGGR